MPLKAKIMHKVRFIATCVAKKIHSGTLITTFNASSFCWLQIRSCLCKIYVNNEKLWWWYQYWRHPSLCSLSYERSIDSAKLSSKDRRLPSASSFNFQYRLISLKSSVAANILIDMFLSLLSFLQYMQDVTNPVILPSLYWMLEVLFLTD